MRWINRIIVALIIFGMGVLVGWQPTFAGVKAFVISGLSLGLVVEVGGFLRELHRDRKEELAKKQERLEQATQKLKERLEQERDKKQIYDWVYHKTEEYKGKKVETGVGSRFNKLNDPRFRSTEEIASALNMYPLEKVKSLCYINDKFTKMTPQDLSREKEKILGEGLLERWAINEFVR